MHGFRVVANISFYETRQLHNVMEFSCLRFCSSFLGPFLRFRSNFAAPSKDNALLFAVSHRRYDVTLKLI